MPTPKKKYGRSGYKLENSIMGSGGLHIIWLGGWGESVCEIELWGRVELQAIPHHNFKCNSP